MIRPVSVAKPVSVNEENSRNDGLKPAASRNCDQRESRYHRENLKLAENPPTDSESSSE
jgi:hypothetical protein